MLVDKMGVKDGKVVTKDFNEKVVYKTDKGIWVEESEGANHKKEYSVRQAMRFGYRQLAWTSSFEEAKRKADEYASKVKDDQDVEDAKKESILDIPKQLRDAEKRALILNKGHLDWMFGNDTPEARAYEKLREKEPHLKKNPPILR